AQRVLEMVEDSLVRPDRPIRFTMTGSAGELPSDIATPLSLILTELLQNAVEHAFVARGGTVTVELKRTRPGLVVVVNDDGAGLPDDFSLDERASLGLQIVRTLATELSGDFSLTSSAGTRAEVTLPLEVT
ncbi:MAG: sensor histidine kinase, partial [Actinomycetota bacterium]